MKLQFLTIVLLFFCYLSKAQTQKDSVYYSKTTAPQTKMIPVFDGKYKVFTQKVGKGPIHLLVLHGGPGNTHEYLENFPEHLSRLGVTVFYYDQLGSYFSDNPDDPSVWNIDRFVKEVEEVRIGLGLDNFYLLGHSWGGMLAELYSAKYGNHLKGLILSNVPGFFADDTKYLNAIIDSIDVSVRHQTSQLPKFAGNKVQIDSITKNLVADNSKFRALYEQFNHANDSLFGRTMYYHKAGKIPESLRRSTKHIQYDGLDKYHFNPFGADYKKALEKIKVPTLILGSKNDFVKPEGYDDLKKRMKNAKVKVHICPNGAHFPMWDDTENYFKALGDFIKQVDTKWFNPKN